MRFRYKLGQINHSNTHVQIYRPRIFLTLIYNYYNLQISIFLVFIFLPKKGAHFCYLQLCLFLKKVHIPVTNMLLFSFFKRFFSVKRGKISLFTLKV